VKYATFCRYKCNGASIDQSLEVIGDGSEAGLMGSGKGNGDFMLKASEVCIRTHRISSCINTGDRSV
jgi:hypothetical protein